MRKQLNLLINFLIKETLYKSKHVHYILLCEIAYAGKTHYNPTIEETTAEGHQWVFNAARSSHTRRRHNKPVLEIICE